MFGLYELFDPRSAKPLHTRTAAEQDEISWNCAYVDATLFSIASLMILLAANYHYSCINEGQLAAILMTIWVAALYINATIHQRQYQAALQFNDACISARGGLNQGQATFLSILSTTSHYPTAPTSGTNQLFNAAHLALDIFARRHDQKSD